MPCIHQNQSNKNATQLPFFEVFSACVCCRCLLQWLTQYSDIHQQKKLNLPALVWQDTPSGFVYISGENYCKYEHNKMNLLGNTHNKIKHPQATYTL
jgi:hypothetical protein